MNHQTEGTPRRRPNLAPSNPGPVKAGLGCKRKPTQGPVSVVPELPAMPPPTTKELAQHHELLRLLREATALAHQRNLDNAVLLAQQAARHGGELAEHFGEIGRRFGHLLDAPSKPTLRLVEGGAA